MGIPAFVVGGGERPPMMAATWGDGAVGLARPRAFTMV